MKIMQQKYVIISENQNIQQHALKKLNKTSKNIILPCSIPSDKTLLQPITSSYFFATILLILNFLV